MSKEPSNHEEASTSPQGGESTKSMTLTLTFAEVKLLASLVSDQLFRRQFIDPKMPGYRPNLDDMTLGKALLTRLRLILDPASKGTAANR